MNSITWNDVNFCMLVIGMMAFAFLGAHIPAIITWIAHRFRDVDREHQIQCGKCGTKFDVRLNMSFCPHPTVQEALYPVKEPMENMALKK